MLKKMTLGLFAMLLSVNLYAGDYDGLWMFDGESDYYTINQNENLLLVVQLIATLDGWDADFGTIEGDTAQMKTLATKETQVMEYTLTFTSATTATQTIVSCTGSPCGDEPGATFTMKKIF